MKKMTQSGQNDDFSDDDFPEEPWDDDFDDLDDVPPLPEGGKIHPSPLKSGRRRTFLQKYFYVLVAVVVAMMFGLWFIGQGGKKSESVLPVADVDSSESQEMPSDLESELSDAPADSQDSESLPMPAPMTSDTSAETRESEGALSSGANDILTPMPDMASGQGGISEEDLPAFDGLGEEPAPSSEQPVVQPVEPEPAMVETPQDEGLAALEAETMNGLSRAGETVPEIQPDPAPVAPAVQDSGIQEKIQALEERNAALAKEKEALERQVSDASDKMVSLEETVSSLQTKLSALEEQQKSAPAAQPVPPAEPAPPALVDSSPTKAPESVASVEKTVPPSVAPAQRTAQKKSGWILRSAQPGQAVLGKKGTEDLQTVSVGQTVSGLGRIKSISVENGKWWVRGTQGSVSQ
ncbi:MAG: hypothetical protein K9G62_08065 [Alphaproteobacteria bacterium]|nr:hypothetical protein [Alphaproteobacteria bacterium]